MKISGFPRPRLPNSAARNDVSHMVSVDPVDDAGIDISHLEQHWDLRVPGPALLVPVKPLGFFGGWVLDEALTSHGSGLVHTYQAIAGPIKTPVGHVQVFGQTMSNQRLKAAPALEVLSFQQLPHSFLRRINSCPQATSCSKPVRRDLCRSLDLCPRIV